MYPRLIFEEYKRSLKKIQKFPSFNQLSLSEKVSAIGSIICSLPLIICYILHFQIGIIISALLMIILSSAPICDSSHRDVELRIKTRSMPYIRKRMDVLTTVLTRYQIDVNDPNAIDQLIELAKEAQKSVNPFIHTKKIIYFLLPFLTAIMGYNIDKIANGIGLETLFKLSVLVILLLFALTGVIMAAYSTLRAIGCLNYDKYENYISDLKQFKFLKANGISLDSFK